MRTATAEPTRDEIERVSRSLRIRKAHVREHSGPHCIADCCFCGKEGHLYLNLDTGLWDCKVCGKAGALWSLADQLGIRIREPTLVKSAASVMMGALPSNLIIRRAKDAPNVNLASVTERCERLFNEGDAHGQKVRAYLHGRGFDDDTIRRFKLHVAAIRDKDSAPELAVGIPYLEGDRVPLVKMRNLESEKDKRKFRRSAGGHSGLFNAEAIRGCKQAVLTEGELDAVSLYQLGITNVASTSLGAQKNIPEEWVQALVDADDVVLFYDNDQAGEEAVQTLIVRLGSYRVRLVTIPDDVAEAVKAKTGKAPKDANDLLRAGVTSEQVRAIIDAATGIDNVVVTKPSRYADQIAKEIDKGEQSLGVPIKWPNLHNLLRGVRTSEVTVITGHTGSGKTTWASEFFELLAADGHPVLLCSLENGPVSLVRKMVQRRVGRPISSLVTEAEKELAYDVLKHLDDRPVYLVDLSGRQPLGSVIDAITYARHKLGVRYVLFDHMHFVKKDPRQDSVEHVENTIATFVEAANKLDVHIAVIAHPSGKVEEGQIPGGDAIKGASAVKQDTHNGISIYRVKDMVPGCKPRKVALRDPTGKKVEIDMGPNTVLALVWKKRHDDAREGMCLFEFEGRSLTYRPRGIDDAEEPRHTRGSHAAAYRDRSDPFDGLDA